MVKEGGVDVGAISSVDTQVVGDEKERVDLAAFDADGHERILLEAKFWADLTDHQPVTYLRRLNRSIPSVLLFVVPNSRAEGLWIEILDRSESKMSINPLIRDGELRVAAVGNNSSRMMLTSWSHLLGVLAQNCDQETKSDLAQLLGLAEKMEKEMFIPWEERDFSREMPAKLQGLRQVIDGAITRGDEQRWIGEQNSSHPRGIEYGRYLWLSGVGVWFGVDFRSWSELGTSPLWAQLKNDDLPDKEKTLRRFARDKSIVKYRMFDDYHYFPITLPAQQDLSRAITSVLVQLNRIARLIDPTVPTYERG
ncbi:MAG: hypothetical protein OXE87_00315 [Chloroflexi bacterium]|nr:hypothetical protein [Chloroflexota bacterium]